MQIASGGDVNLLVIEGKESIETLVVKWEELVKVNSKHIGSGDYEQYYEMLKMYNILMADLVLVKALLTFLIFYPKDYDYIQQVRRLGYKISLSNDLEYVESLTAAMQRSENLKTKIESKQKEINTYFVENEANKNESFQQVLAHINAGIGFSIGEDIKLSAYNEYRKILKERAKQQQRGRD